MTYKILGSPGAEIIQMRKRKGKIHIGTSGWHYKHWTGTFYPETIKGSRQFDEYKKRIDYSIMDLTSRI